MTYGQAATAMRSAMTQLLSGLGPDAVVTESDDGPDVETIRRYRSEVHKYALDLLAFARSGLSPDGQEATGRALAELERLREPTLNCTVQQLIEQHASPLTDAWRRAAVAAVVGRERELPHLADIPVEERVLLTMDAASLVNALLLADARFIRLPDWQPIGGDIPMRRVQRGQDPLRSKVHHMLARALDDCTRWARSRISASSCVVDDRGYRPAADVTLDDGSPCAQAAALVHEAANKLCNEYPDARHFALLLSTNQFLTAHAARLTKEAGNERHSETFTGRAVTYQVLAAAFRANITGRASRDVSAVGLAQRALALLQNLPHTSADQLDNLNEGFERMDHRVSTTIQRGIEDGRYVTSRRKRLAHVPGGGVRTHFVPIYEAITEETHPDLLRRAREMEQDQNTDWYQAKPERIRSSSVLERLQFDALVGGRLRRAQQPGGAVQPHVEILVEPASALAGPDEPAGLEI